MNPWLLTLPIAYLLGSIPFGYILVRVFRRQDIRATGSGNTGATNVAREAKGLGLATLALDLGKAAAAVLVAFQVARHYGFDPVHAYDLAVVAAVAAILGHVFPVWLRFRGGKGVACALGIYIVLLPLGAVGILSVFLVVLALTRYVSLASIAGAASYPLFALLLLRHTTPVVWAGFLMIPALVIAMHHGNIGRLLAGTESRIGSKKTTTQEPA